ncbi:hypothetical protein AJ80_09168 [Polytolypa hystricis UAMH7299]|uniref:Uncharacterized protein n=1 Tax=Polytolypa hystricis (strain UAMH7299) TaxID=1447883 RepID=A0A2B7WV92_POLH7|nr:hypothetical protein AJ80_09168 [Polytolypa hystricis UAMH7299]
MGPHHRNTTHLSSSSEASERFRFTPIASIKKKKAPRLWDRKPTTPFAPRSKSHKVWKRFLASTTSREGGIIGGTDDHEAYGTEINASAGKVGLRGVKRLRIGGGGGRSFLETKWEVESVARRRKYVRSDGEAQTCIAPESAGKIEVDGEVEGPVCAAGETHEQGQGDGDVADEVSINPATTAAALAEQADTDYAIATPLQARNTMSATEESVGDGAINEVDVAEELNEVTMTNAELVQDIEEDSDNAAITAITLFTEDSEPIAAPIRNHRLLESDDAEILTDFLSRARAKREAAAKSAMLDKEDDCQKEVASQTPTTPPRQRRVLEDLDKNSPSSPRLKLRSVAKSGDAPDSSTKLSLPAEQQDIKPEAKGEENNTDDNDQYTRAPTPYRRSTRMIVPKPKDHTPTVPNHIPLRRSNGTEFVFLQRSEASQLALTTKANTKRNQGSAQYPCVMLPLLRSKALEDDDSSDELNNEPQKPSSRKRGKSAKSVKWNDEWLVQYEGETPPEATDPETNEDVQSSEPVTSSQSSKKGKRSTTKRSLSQLGSAAIASQPPRSPARARKMRKLGTGPSDKRGGSGAILAGSTLATITAAAAVAATSIPTPPALKSAIKTSTLQKDRKKLAPKSQKMIAVKIPDTTTITTAANAADAKRKDGAASGGRKTRTLSTKISGTPISSRIRARA